MYIMGQVPKSRNCTKFRPLPNLTHSRQGMVVRIQPNRDRSRRLAEIPLSHDVLRLSFDQDDFPRLQLFQRHVERILRFREGSKPATLLRQAATSRLAESLADFTVIQVRLGAGEPSAGFQRPRQPATSTKARIPQARTLHHRTTGPVPKAAFTITFQSADLRDAARPEDDLRDSFSSLRRAERYIRPGSGNRRRAVSTWPNHPRLRYNDVRTGVPLPGQRRRTHAKELRPRADRDTRRR